MSKTILIIGGAAAGTAVVAGGTAAGIVVSQSNTQTVDNSQAQAVLNQVTTILKAASLDHSKSAITLYPNGTSTVFTDAELTKLGLSNPFENYTVEVSLTGINASSLTFDVRVSNSTQSASDSLTLTGFNTGTVVVSELTKLINELNNQSFTINDHSLMIEEFVAKVNSLESTNAKLEALLALSETLATHKSALESMSQSVALEVDNSTLKVTVALALDSQTGSLSFSLTDFVTGQSQLDSIAENLAKTYVAKETVSTKSFVESATKDNIADLVDGLSANLDNVTITNLVARTYSDTATDVTFDLTVQLNGTSLTKTVLIGVNNLTSISTVEKEQEQAVLDQIVTNINGKTYSIIDTSTSVSQFMNIASVSTIAALINESFTEALGQGNISTLTLEPSTTDENAVVVKATIKVNNLSAEVSFSVNQLVANTTAEADAQLDKVHDLLNGKTFSATTSQLVEEFVLQVNPQSVKGLLSTPFALALDGAIIKSASASASASDSSQAIVTLTLAYANTTKEVGVTFNVDNLQAADTRVALLEELAGALTGDYSSSNTSLSTTDFEAQISKETLTSLVSGIESKLNGLTVNSVEAVTPSASSTSVTLNLVVQLNETDLTKTVVIGVTNLVAQSTVENQEQEKELAAAVKDVENKTFTVSNTSTSVSDFLKNSATTISVALGDNFTTALGKATLSNVTISADPNSEVQAIVSATLNVGDHSQVVNFTVSGLLSDKVVAADKTLNAIVSAINDQTFAAQKQVEAQLFASQVNADTVKSLINSAFSNNLGSVVTITSASAIVDPNNLSLAKVTMTLNYTYASSSKEVVFYVNNLLKAPESESAQDQLDAIASLLSGQTYSPLTTSVNTTFVNEATPSKLADLLNASFKAVLGSASIVTVKAQPFDSVASSVVLNLTLSLAKANNRTTFINVNQLITQQQADHNAANAKVESLVNSLSATSMAVNSAQQGINTKTYSDLLATDLTNALPSALTSQLSDYTVSLANSSYTPMTGDTVVVDLNVQAYEGAPVYTIKGLTLTGLVSYGVLDGNAYLETALNNALFEAVRKIVAEVGTGPVKVNLTADRYAATVLVRGGSDVLSQLTNFGASIGLDTYQVQYLTNLVLDVPSLTSVGDKDFSFEVKFNGQTGNLFLNVSTTALGPVLIGNQTMQASYKASASVSLANLISFNSGHYVDMAKLVAQVDKSALHSKNWRLASQLPDYYKRAGSAIESLRWITDDVDNDTIRTIANNAKAISNLVYTVTGPYRLNVRATVTSNEDTLSYLNFNLEMNRPEYETIDSGVSVVENWDMIAMFNYTITSSKDALANFVRKYGGDRAFVADQIDAFANMNDMRVDEASAGSKDTMMFTLISPTGQFKVAIKIQPLTDVTIEDYIDAAINTSMQDRIFRLEWIRTGKKIYDNSSWDDRNWVKGVHPLNWAFYYRNDRVINVANWMDNKRGGFQSMVLSAINRSGNENHTLAQASVNFSVVSENGNKLVLFANKTYEIRFYSASESGPASSYQWWQNEA